jgi:hypothetical protein
VSVRVLALDLERTLIDDARSARPRPGLLDFLAFCHEQFERVAVFTTVAEADARDVLRDLACRGHLPAGLLDRLEYVNWCGAYKDRSCQGRFPRPCCWSMTTAGGCGRTSAAAGLRLRVGTVVRTASCRACSRCWRVGSPKSQSQRLNQALREADHAEGDPSRTRRSSGRWGP